MLLDVYIRIYTSKSKSKSPHAIYIFERLYQFLGGGPGVVLNSV